MDNPILLDCDGVLADFSKGICDLQEEGDLTPDKVNKWDIFSLLTLADEKIAREQLSDPDWWFDLPVMEGAREGYEALSSRHDVMIVTSPWYIDGDVMAGWVDARTAWLRQEFGIKGASVMPAKHKHLIKGRQLIDDHYDNVAKYLEVWEGKALLFDAPYNKKKQAVRTDWDDIIKRVEDGRL